MNIVEREFLEQNQMAVPNGAYLGEPSQIGAPSSLRIIPTEEGFQENQWGSLLSLLGIPFKHDFRGDSSDRTPE